MVFRADNEYCGRFICNHDTCVTITILKRTPKMVKTQDNLTKDIKWKKIYNVNSTLIDYFSPRPEFICYCPGVTISANNKIEEHMT